MAGGSFTAVYFYEGASAPPTCPTHSTLSALGGTDPNGAPVTCSACGCGAPGCGGEISYSQYPASGNCTGMSALGEFAASSCVTPSTGGSIVLNEPQSSCTPSGGIVTARPPVTWTTNGETCAAEDLGGCGAAAVCVGAVSQFTACIAAPPGPAAAGCPGDFPVQHLVHTSVDDTRACAMCACDTGPTCIGGVFKFDTAQSQCTSLGTANQFGQCVSIGSPAEAFTVTKLPTANGSCASTGGGPVGSVSAGTTLVTVCCAN